MLYIEVEGEENRMMASIGIDVVGDDRSSYIILTTFFSHF